MRHESAHASCECILELRITDLDRRIDRLQVLLDAVIVFTAALSEFISALDALVDSKEPDREMKREESASQLTTQHTGERLAEGHLLTGIE